MKQIKKFIKFPKKITLNNAKDYFKKLNLLKDIRNKNIFPPNIIDLYRIHQFIILNNRTSVLEYGCGWSCLIIVHALNQNLKRKKIIGSLNYEFEIIENVKKFLEICKKRNKIVSTNKIKIKYNFSKCYWTEFNKIISSSYKKITSISPNFIYLDGPDPNSVLIKKTDGIKQFKTNLLPMSCDILKFEYHLIPGTIILIDGRTSNATFLKKNFKRDWVYFHDLKNDQSLFYLNEKPLGLRNEKQLVFFRKNFK